MSHLRWIAGIILALGSMAFAGDAQWIQIKSEHFSVFTDAGDLIIADLSPKGYKELSRANIITPTQPNSGRNVVWCHPAFANKCVFVRNDTEIVCVSLAG